MKAGGEESQGGCVLRFQIFQSRLVQTRPVRLAWNRGVRTETAGGGFQEDGFRISVRNNFSHSVVKNEMDFLRRQ